MKYPPPLPLGEVPLAEEEFELDDGANVPFSVLGCRAL